MPAGNEMEPRKWHARRPPPTPPPAPRTPRRTPPRHHGAAPAADSPAAAVYAALEANPGSTVAVIADAAGTGKPAARAALLEMEKAGTAARVKGDRPGIPDTWTLVGPAPDGTSPAAAPEAGQVGQPGDDPAGSPDPAAEDETADGAGHDGTAEAVDPAAPAPEAAEPEPDDAPAEADHEDAVPDEPDAEAEPGSDPADERRPARRGRPGGRATASPATSRTRPWSRT